jgi:hypothetical protein
MSKDNGNTWKSIDSSLVLEPDYLGTGVSYSSRNNVVSAAGRYVYAITTRGKYLLIGTSAGVYVSSDTGRTWTARNKGLIFNRPRVYCFAFKDNETYIGTNLGVYFSSDTGKNWVHKKNGVKDFNLTIVDLVLIGDNLIAATYMDGTYISKDKGNTWQESMVYHSYDGRALSWYGANHFSDLELNQSRIFAGGAGTFISRDSGRTWPAFPKSLGPTGVNSISIAGDTVLASIPGYSTADSAELYMSTDECKSWRKMRMPRHVTGNWTGAPDNWRFLISTFNTPSQGAFDIYIHKNDFFMGTDFGILKSTDRSVSWQSSDNGVMKMGITSLCKSGNLYFAGTSANGIFISEDNCATWKQVNNGLEDQWREGGWYTGTAWKIRALAVKDSLVFAATDGSGIFCSSNNGASWSAVNSGLIWRNIQALTVAGKNIFAGTTAGVFVTNNNGSTWIQIGNPQISSMASIGKNIYCVIPWHGVFMSPDQGYNWKDISGDIPVSDFSCVTEVDSTVFVGSIFEGMLRKYDNRNTWSRVNNGFRQDNAGLMILSLFSKGPVIYAGTGAGVYKSYDKGEHWIPANDGIPAEGVQYLGLIDNTLYAGTVGDGLFKMPFRDTTIAHLRVIDTTTISKNPGTCIPDVKAKAFNVYPNPAQDEITISFDYFSDEEYIVEFLSITGNVLLKTRVNKTLNKISLEGLNYHGFCIPRITGSNGRIAGIQKMIRL